MKNYEKHGYKHTPRFEKAGGVNNNLIMWTLLIMFILGILSAIYL